MLSVEFDKTFILFKESKEDMLCYFLQTLIKFFCYYLDIKLKIIY